MPDSYDVRKTHGTILSLCSALLFGAMLYSARWFPERFNPLDARAEAVVHPLQTFGLSEPFLILTVLGSGIGILTLALGSAYFLRNDRFTVGKLAILLLGSSVSMTLAKAFVERGRPDVLQWLVSLHSYSFPSGHATLSTAFYGFMGVVLYRRSGTALTRALSVAVPFLIVGAVCLSRVVLGYHYFTDVVAGVLLGLCWLGLLLMLPERRAPSSHI